MALRSEQLEERFVQLLDDRYPLGPSWSDPAFHCYRDLPHELRLWAAMSFFEQETSNGSLAQVFWNSCPNEKELLQLCEDGYRMIGATEHTEAIGAVRRLFEQWDTEAETYIRRDVDGDESAFDEWCSKYDISGNGSLDKLFFLSRDESPYQVRCRWLEENEKEVRYLIEACL